MSALWGHAQTVTAAIPLALPFVKGMRAEQVELPLRDHGDHGVLVAAVEWQPRRAPAVIVVHGVGGSSDDAYVLRAARALARHGYHVVRPNQRGSGRGVGRAWQLYHAGMNDDLTLVQRFLEAKDDVTDIGILGFSLGGHVALTHAAAVGADVGLRGRLAAIASVSAPVDLAAGMRIFDSHRGTVFGIYEKRIVRSLVGSARALLDRGAAAPFTAAELDVITDLRTFDDVVTARCHGFDGVGDYHVRASVGPHLARIALPTLMLHAMDDPMVPVEPLLQAHARGATSASIDVVVVPSGGHVGFVMRPWELWGENAAVARAAAHFRRHFPSPDEITETSEPRATARP